MNILICASTSMELVNPSSKRHQIETLITGAGSPATCFQLGKRFASKLPDLAIQIGIAGSFLDTVPIGEVVQIYTDSFADLGAQDKDGSFIGINQLVTMDYPFGLAEFNPSNRLLLNDIQEVKAITVNKVHGFPPDINRIRAICNPEIETMEGAAFFMCCMAYGLPCCQIRSISNRVEARNREAWDIPLALKNLHVFVEKWIKDLD